MDDFFLLENPATLAALFTITQEVKQLRHLARDSRTALTFVYVQLLTRQVHCCIATLKMIDVSASLWYLFQLEVQVNNKTLSLLITIKYEIVRMFCSRKFSGATQNPLTTNLNYFIRLCHNI